MLLSLCVVGLIDKEIRRVGFIRVVMGSEGNKTKNLKTPFTEKYQQNINNYIERKMHANLRSFHKPYWETIYREIDKLSNEAIEEKINTYKEARKRRDEMGAIRGLFHDIFIGMPLFLDIHPLIDPQHAYLSALEIKDFRKRNGDIPA